MCGVYREDIGEILLYEVCVIVTVSFDLFQVTLGRWVEIIYSVIVGLFSKSEYFQTFKLIYANNSRF